SRMLGSVRGPRCLGARSHSSTASSGNSSGIVSVRDSSAMTASSRTGVVTRYWEAKAIPMSVGLDEETKKPTHYIGWALQLLLEDHFTFFSVSVFLSAVFSST